MFLQPWLSSIAVPCLHVQEHVVWYPGLPVARDVVGAAVYRSRGRLEHGCAQLRVPSRKTPFRGAHTGRDIQTYKSSE